METLKAIATRRSIRIYQDKPIPKEVTTLLLRAAMQAPSATNQQPWHFVTVDDRETLRRIAEMHPNAGMAVLAPLAIVICGDTRTLKSPSHWTHDCSAATQNLLLAAHDCGLGAVWSAICPNHSQEKAFADLLGLPAGVIPLAVVPLGYPAEVKEPEDRYQPDRVHHNRW